MAENTEKGTLAGGEYEAEDVLADAEPWEGFETKTGSMVVGNRGSGLIIGFYFSYPHRLSIKRTAYGMYHSS